MYYWRLWREKRVRFFALLILGVCVGASTWPQAHTTAAAVHIGHGILAERGSLRLGGGGKEHGAWTTPRRERPSSRIE